MGKRRRSLSLIANLMRDMGMTDVSPASEFAAEIVTPRSPPLTTLSVPNPAQLHFRSPHW